MKLNGTNRNSFSLSSNKLSSSYSHALKPPPPKNQEEQLTPFFLINLLVMTFLTGKKLSKIISELSGVIITAAHQANQNSLCIFF